MSTPRPRPVTDPQISPAAPPVVGSVVPGTGDAVDARVQDFWAALAATVPDPDAAGAAVAALARLGAVGALAHLLRPDRATDASASTVVCYEVGSITPVAVRELADLHDGVLELLDCGEPRHAAAELVLSTAEGLQWVALSRADNRVAFHLPTTDNVTGNSDDVLVAVGAWSRSLALQRSADPAVGSPTGNDAVAAPGGAPMAPMVPVIPPAVGMGRGATGSTSARRPTPPTPPTPPTHGGDLAITVRNLQSSVRSAMAEVVPQLADSLARGMADGDAGAMRLTAADLDAARRLVTDLPALDAALETALSRARAELDRMPRRVTADLRERLVALERSLPDAGRLGRLVDDLGRAVSRLADAPESLGAGDVSALLADSSTSVVERLRGDLADYRAAVDAAVAGLEARLDVGGVDRLGDRVDGAVAGLHGEAAALRSALAEGIDRLERSQHDDTGAVREELDAIGDQLRAMDSVDGRRDAELRTAIGSLAQMVDRLGARLERMEAAAAGEVAPEVLADLVAARVLDRLDRMGRLDATAPAEVPRVETAPVDVSPVDVAPVDPAPVERAPVDRASVDRAPVDRAPVDPSPAEPPRGDDPLADGIRAEAIAEAFWRGVQGGRGRHR